MSFARTVRILTVTSTTTITPLRTLIDAALVVKGTKLPNNEPIEVRLSPDVDIEVADIENTDPLIIIGGTTWIAPSREALDVLTIKNAATVVLEMFFG